MNDDQQNNKQENSNNVSNPQDKTPEKKVWVKGSHRNGKRPKLKWI